AEGENPWTTWRIRIRFPAGEGALDVLEMRARRDTARAAAQYRAPRHGRPREAGGGARRWRFVRSPEPLRRRHAAGMGALGPWAGRRSSGAADARGRYAEVRK